MGYPRALSGLFSVFFKQNFYSNIMWKNVRPVSGTGIRAQGLSNASLLS